MRGSRVKRLKAIFLELVSRDMAPKEDRKKHFRFFKKLYKSGQLKDFLPSM